MSNAVLQGRDFATAAMAAFFLSGQAGQAGPNPSEASPTVVRFSHLDGSAGGLNVVDTVASPDSSLSFSRTVHESFGALASRQRSLDPDVAQALAAEAWDLYDEA